MASYAASHTVSHSTRRAPAASQTLAVAGATALVLGLIVVIAFNWAGLGKFTKFALVQGLLIALTAAAIFRRHSQRYLPAPETDSAQLGYLPLGSGWGYSTNDSRQLQMTRSH
jgi:uncharacterized membrane protein